MNRVDFISKMPGCREERAMPVKADSTWENRASKAVLLIRVLVGWVFLSEA